MFKVQTYNSAALRTAGGIEETMEASTKREAYGIAQDEVERGMWVEVFNDGELEGSMAPEGEEE